MKLGYIVSVMVAVLASACGNTANNQDDGLIRECPEEKVVNRMPTVIEEGQTSEPEAYFIYKGQRRELKEFDLDWVEANCEVTETEVHLENGFFQCLRVDYSQG